MGPSLIQGSSVGPRCGNKLASLANNRYPPPVHCSGCARLIIPGQQTINRAEQCAVIAAARLTMQSEHITAEVWSDSAFAIQAHERAVLSEVSTHPDLGDLLHYYSSLPLAAAPCIRINHTKTSLCCKAWSSRTVPAAPLPTRLPKRH